MRRITTMQQTYVVGAAETEPAKAADAAKASNLPAAPLDKDPPPPPKKKRPTEKGQSSKAANNEMYALADILLALVNEKTLVEDLEKLRTKMVKQSSKLHQKQAEVLSLLQEAKAENEKVSARKNLFTTTPVAEKPPK